MRMIPGGNAVANAMAEGRLGLPLLLVSDEPRLDHNGNLIGKISRWEADKESDAKGVPCMVLPDGAVVDSFAWPKQHPNWRALGEWSLDVWAWDLTFDSCRPLGAALVIAGFDSVRILYGRAGGRGYATFTAG